MIKEELTYKQFGYYSYELARTSHKRVVIACNKCGKIRVTHKHSYRDLCRHCARVGKHSSSRTEFKKGHKLTNEIIEAMKIRNRGSHNPNYGNHKLAGKNNPMFGIHRFGKKAPGYIDGRTPLSQKIRHLEEYQNWRNFVYKRDNYTCQNCWQYGGKLEVHHKQHFAEILSEFLKEYDQFSPLEDKETLARLASKWKPFWVIDNGETLCHNCHIKIRSKI